MRSWLSSSSWEPNWRSFQYFNLYRLVVVALLVAMGTSVGGWLSPFRLEDPALFDWAGVSYVLVAGGGALLSVRWQRGFNTQLSCQLLADVVGITLLMYAVEGLSSGLGILLLVSLAAASLLGSVHLALFYAALATVAVLSMQAWSMAQGDPDAVSLLPAIFLGLGFFVTALLARFLAQRIMAHEELARRRGIDLDNQTRISQRIIERMQDGVLIVGRDALVCRGNPVAGAMLGASAQAGKPLADCSAQLAAAFTAWLQGQGEEAVHFTDQERELRARFEQTDSSSGEVLVFLEDVGRIKERAQQLTLASLGRLTASIAHEIRNPLAAISHAGDLLREERRGPMQDRLLRIMGDNVARLDRIVQDILELGRRDRTHPECLRLDQFVRDFVAEYGAAQLSDPEVLLVEASEEAELCFDRSQLQQVLWNLVGNALRHCRGRKGSVRLMVAVADGVGRVELHVIDDGPGVPDTLRAQVFEPFFTTGHKGTGLGLFIARELCEANGATLELGPDANRGHFILAGRKDWCQTNALNAVPAGT